MDPRWVLGPVCMVMSIIGMIRAPKAAPKAAEELKRRYPNRTSLITEYPQSLTVIFGILFIAGLLVTLGIFPGM